MESKSDKQFVEPLLKTLRKFQNNNRCLYPGCPKQPIGSHVIAESVLEQLADNEGKVLTWDVSDNDIVVNTLQGHEWDHVYKQPRRVGIRQEVTYPIFCNEHDNGIFAELEDTGFTFQQKQVALLAYRALCYKSWNPNLEKKLEFALSNQDPETALQLERIFSLKPLLAARQKFEDMLAVRDYRQMRWITRILHIDPCFACVNATIPYDGDEDAKNIASGSTIRMPEDYITFTFFPDRNLDASICVITWFKDNRRAWRFIESLELDNPSEAVVRNNIIDDALKMSLVYASQEWFDALSPELQAYISELQLSNIISLQNL